MCHLEGCSPWQWWCFELGRKEALERWWWWIEGRAAGCLLECHPVSCYIKCG